MALLPKSACHIHDWVVTLHANSSGLVDAALSGTVTATPSVAPLYVQQSDGTYALMETPVTVSAAVGTDGSFDLFLPPYTDCDPQIVAWTIATPDGTKLSGLVTSAMVTGSVSANAGAGYTLHDLKNGGLGTTWSLVTTVGTPVQTIEGPPGAVGPAKVKAGTPTDADFATTPPDGTLVVDAAANKIWARANGAWKYTALT